MWLYIFHRFCFPFTNWFANCNRFSFSLYNTQAPWGRGTKAPRTPLMGPLPNDIINLWQYGLWSFQSGGTKLERFLHKNQHTQRKLLNFGLMARCHRFILFFVIEWLINRFYRKMSITKNVFLYWYSSVIKKIEKDSYYFNHSKFGTFWRLPISPKLKIQ